jgi:hypothetical protein
MTDISATNFFRQAAGETSPLPQLPPEQEEALGHPDFIQHKHLSLGLAKNPVPGTAIWRGEAREGAPHDAVHHSGVGLHWSVNPDSAFTPPPGQGQRRMFWQGRVDNPAEQTIPRSHPSWDGRTRSMDHEAEVRLKPGSRVHIDGAYVWHGQDEPHGHPTPMAPERTHPDWKWHPVGQHAEVHNHGHISYDLSEPQHSDAKMPPPWTGANPRAVLEHEHAAGNHHAVHPGGSYDDIDWDAPGEHVDGHSAAVMTDGVLKDGWTKPHELDDHDTTEWLRWHPDRAGIEQRHHGRTASLTTTAAVQNGDDIPSRFLNPHGHHIRANVGGHTNVEMVPREEVERYASQPTDTDHVKEVGHHLATSGQMEPLMLHYHPASGEAYLGEGNHRLRAAKALGMDHVPLRISRSNYGLPGPGVKVPQDHPAIAAGGHVPADIHPSHIGLTTVDKPSISQVDLDSARHDYNLTGRPRLAAAESPESIAEWGSGSKPCPCCQGQGEHGTGYECYLCDGSMSVGQDTPEDYRCEGTLPDGGHGKTATYAENPLPAEIDSWKNTQWDVPHQVDGPMHRGLTIPLSPEDHAHVHDQSVSPSKRAAHIVKLVSKDGNLGRHWTTDADMANHFSTSAAGELGHHPHLLAVSLHAHPPEPEHIEHDPVELGRMGVKAQSVEAEIPLKHDAPVRMYGVSWHNPRDHSQSGRYIATGQAKGIIRNATADTPVPDNTQPYQHEHDWLPHGHFFGPGKKGLDPRLFDENDRMHPIVRQYLLSLLNSFWTPKYGDSWQSWARVYLTGSEASHWYGNGDLDILIGVDHEALNHHIDHFTGEPDNAVDEHLTNQLREGLNDDHRMLPGPDGKDTGPWESTFYVNPGSYDIKALKPYAAYDITRDEWAVKPVEVPDDFGPEKLPESTWDVLDALTKLIGAIAELPDETRDREGAALYDYLHADRHSAFGPEGSGLYDPGNAVWKALDKAPGQPLQQLIDWKHAHDGTAATDLETAA